MNETKERSFFDQFADIEPYNYTKAVAEDIREAINDLTVEEIETATNYSGRPLYFLENTIKDTVTGLPEGLYWGTEREAECCIFGNRDLLEEVAWENEDEDVLSESPRGQDSCIRQHVFDEANEMAYKKLYKECFEYLTDKELLFLILVSKEWDFDYLRVAAGRVNEIDKWNEVIYELDFTPIIAYKIIDKLKIHINNSQQAI